MQCNIRRIFRVFWEKKFSYFRKHNPFQMFVRILNTPLNVLREKCPYSELFWSLFSRILTEYGEMLLISPYSVEMWKNTDQKNSEYGHFLRSDILTETHSHFFLPMNQ